MHGVNINLTTPAPHLVQQHYVSIKQKVTRHIQSLLLGQGQVGHSSVHHLLQTKILNQSIYLQEKRLGDWRTIPQTNSPCPYYPSP